MEEPTIFVLTKKYIQKAAPNSIDIANNKESYDNYFKLGGTISKMTVVSAYKYFLHTKKRVEEKENS